MLLSKHPSLQKKGDRFTEMKQGNGETNPESGRQGGEEGPKTNSGKRSRRPLYIVGMGGSAGSLEAFGQFFQNLPPDTGMAFIVVPHLDPTHKGVRPYQTLEKWLKDQRRLCSPGPGRQDPGLEFGFGYERQKGLPERES
jgi:hypothetical protein